MKQPHVVFIVADQLRYDMLGRGLTPNIDSIAGDGVIFDRAYCACPLCVPSRGSLFTGTYPSRNGSMINPWLAQDAAFGMVGREFETFYELMERGGWYCMHSGKQHLFTEGGKLEDRKDTRTKWLCTEKTYIEMLKEDNVRMPGGETFKSFVPEMSGGKYTRVNKYSNPSTGCYEPGEKYYFDGYFTQKALEGLRGRDRERPLFLSAMFLAPHPPFDVPEPYYSAIAEEEIQLADNVGKWYEYQSPLQMYNLTGIIGTQYTLEAWRESWQVYMGLVCLLDNQVGKLLDELKRQGIYDDSLIVFTSDHGEMLGSHRLFQKMCMYEESVRTPIYLKLPGNQKGGRKIHTPVSQIDLMPTLCDYLHLKPRHDQDGNSLMDMMEDVREEKQGERSIFIQFDGNGSRSNFQRCIVQGDFKLIVDLFKDETYYELYNILEDPQESRNLLFVDNSGAASQTAAQMLKALLVHMENTKDPIRITNTDIDSFIDTYRQLSRGTM